MANENKPWLSITLALITVIGSISGAYITSKATSKDEVKDVFKSFKPIHIESGIVEVTGREADFNNPSPNKQVAINFTPRRYIKHIAFDDTYGFTPIVRVSISALDADNGFNTIIQTYPTQISTKGFDLVIQTWSKSKINFVNAGWFAYEQRP